MLIDAIVDQPINVKYLEMPEKAAPSELPFDAVRDLTDKQKSDIFHMRSWSDVFESTAFGLEFPFRPKPHSKEIFSTLVDKVFMEKHISDQIKGFAKLRLLFPKEFSSLSLAKGDISSFESLLLNDPTTVDIHYFFYYKVLNPDFQLNEEDWIDFRNHYFSDLHYESARSEGLSSVELIRRLSYLRLLDPQRYATLPQVDERTWKTAISFLQQTAVPLGDAEYATVVAADEAKLTENGVEIVMRKPQSSVRTPPPVPEERSF